MRRPSCCLFPIVAALLTCAPGLAQTPAPGGGERTFRDICSACHSVLPPAKQAPPMAMIARRYMAADTSPAAVVERLAAWVASPARERSLLPPMALERWGLMPPLLLPEAQRREVAAYVLTLAEPGAAGAMGHGRMGRGGGPPLRRGRVPGRRSGG